MLLQAAARHGRPLSAALLQQVIDAPGKRRFEARDGRVRAAQGHSVPVDLGLEPARPPAVLYHGTVARFLPAILAEGLRPGQRFHVHLATDPGIAAGPAGHPADRRGEHARGRAPVLPRGQRRLAHQ